MARVSESVVDMMLTSTVDSFHRPCHTIPGTPVSEKTIALTDDNHERIESAFRSIFHRAPAPPPPTEQDNEEQPKGEHEFEVIVCHANVIRYWMCRYVLFCRSQMRAARPRTTAVVRAEAV